MIDIDTARTKLEGDFSVEALAGVIPKEWIREVLEDLGPGAVRGRTLSGPFMVWFVVLLGLFRRVSYENIVEKLRRSWWGRRMWRKRPDSSALTKARDRIGVAPMCRLFDRTAQLWTGSNEGELAAGRRVRVLDGLTYKVPDTEANRDHFGLPGNSRGRSAHPQMRGVQLLDLGTRIVCDVEVGVYSEGEITLARRMLERMPVGSLILLDRNFLAFDFLHKLRHDRSCDFIVRAKKLAKSKVVAALSGGDDIVDVKISRPARKRERRLKKTWRLRRVTFCVARPNGTVQTITVLTSILDPDLLSKHEIAELYLRRWEIETAHDELKTHLADCATVNRPVTFRSKRPDRVKQELYGFLTAYNAVRRLICDSAQATGAEPLRVSFTAALSRIREAIEAMAHIPTTDLPRRHRELLSSLSQTLVPYRPDRDVRREVKVKMSKYPVKKYRLTGS